MTEQRVRATTWGSYRRDVERLEVALGKVPLGRLSPHVVQVAYQRMRVAGLSARSVERTHSVLRRALNQAVGWGVLASNPALLAAPPRLPRRQMTALDATQARRLLDSTHDDRWFSLWALLIGTGLRLGEALALTWSDVNLEAGNVAVRRTLQRNLGHGLVFAAPKTAQSRRSVPMPAFVIAALRTGKGADPSSLVFSNRRGGPQDPGSVNSALTRSLRRAGLPHVRVHDLRHTTASILLASSTHPKVVQELLGHRTVALTLDIYSHLLPPMLRTAAIVMDSALTVGVNSAAG